MIRLLHCANVHLKADEKAYDLAVLREIVETANSEKVNFLLICGDLFDSFGDAEALRRDVAEIANACVCEILYIPGNHEEHGKTGALNNFDFGKLKPFTKTPCDKIVRELKDDSIEFLAIPHQNDYFKWRDWEISAPETRARVALVHATVENMAYIGPEDSNVEEGGGILGSEFFSRNKVLYAALGHIHGCRRQTIEGSVLAYPGSATVWRKGETGARKIMLVDIDQGKISDIREKTISSAGQYRRCEIPLLCDGSMPDIASAVKQFGTNDMIELVLTGIIENESLFRDIETVLQDCGSTLLRTTILNKEKTGVFPGLAKQPLAASFLRKWQQGPPADGTIKPEVWARSRQLALESIMARMEARQ